jgi:hypothetical protein
MTTSPPTTIPPYGRSALVGLYRSMADYFESFAVPAKVLYGLKARDLWNTSRVVVIDGEFKGELVPKALPAGTLSAPTQKKSFNPREIVSWTRPVTLSIRGVDSKNPDDEALQTEALETLIEWTIRAVQNAVFPLDGGGGIGLGQANLEWGDAIWLSPPVQQPFGKELLQAVTLHCVFFDVPSPVVVPPAVLSAQLLNSKRSGQAASITSNDDGTVLVTGLAFCNPSYVGQNLVIAGAASPGNNGLFPITSLVSRFALEITNPACVAGDANNGKIAWSVQAP